MDEFQIKVLSQMMINTPLKLRQTVRNLFYPNVRIDFIDNPYDNEDERCPVSCAEFSIVNFIGACMKYPFFEQIYEYNRAKLSKKELLQVMKYFICNSSVCGNVSSQFYIYKILKKDVTIIETIKKWDFVNIRPIIYWFMMTEPTCIITPFMKNIIETRSVTYDIARELLFNPNLNTDDIQVDVEIEDEEPFIDKSLDRIKKLPYPERYEALLLSEKILDKKLALTLLGTQNRSIETFGMGLSSMRNPDDHIRSLPDIAHYFASEENELDILRARTEIEDLEEELASYFNVETFDD